MNKEEAIQIIETELDGFRSKSYAELSELIDKEPATAQRTSQSGKEYQTEVNVFWDGEPGGDIRVIGNIDDGGWRAYFPLGVDFIKRKGKMSEQAP